MERATGVLPLLSIYMIRPLANRRCVRIHRYGCTFIRCEFKGLVTVEYVRIRGRREWRIHDGIYAPGGHALVHVSLHNPGESTWVSLVTDGIRFYCVCGSKNLILSVRYSLHPDAARLAIETCREYLEEMFSEVIPLDENPILT